MQRIFWSLQRESKRTSMLFTTWIWSMLLTTWMWSMLFTTWIICAMLFTTLMCCMLFTTSIFSMSSTTCVFPCDPGHGSVYAVLYYAMCTVAAAAHDTQHVHIRDTFCATLQKTEDNNNISAILITNKHLKLS